MLSVCVRVCVCVCVRVAHRGQVMVPQHIVHPWVEKSGRSVVLVAHVQHADAEAAPPESQQVPRQPVWRARAFIVLTQRDQRVGRQVLQVRIVDEAERQARAAQELRDPVDLPVRTLSERVGAR